MQNSNDYPWSSPLYKATSRICEEFWVDYLSSAKLLIILHYAQKPKRGQIDYEKKYEAWVNSEPTVYSVFDKLRQDYHNELPYGKRFITEIDKTVENEVRKEVARIPREILK